LSVAGFAQGGSAASNTPIKVLNSRRLPANAIPAARTPLGIPNDYKPWIARLKNGELLIVAFYSREVSTEERAQGKRRSERAVFWRSKDDGKTWGEREERPDVQGREFSLNVISDGVILMPCHFLKQDVNNKAGHTYSKLFRSVDNGRTWKETRIGPKGFPPKAQTATDWTAFEVPDARSPGGKMVMFGVSMQHGGEAAPKNVYLWRSRDSGRKWDKSLNPTTYRAASGKLLHAVRVDRTGPHWLLPGTEMIKREAGDQGDRMMLWESLNNGASWQKHDTHGTFGTYGEMYPRFLKLKDGRLLLTFTVRSNSSDGHALGLRAIVSYDDGESWDFEHDRLVIDAQNVGASGGGFGNTVQLDDGTLFSCYSYRGSDGATHIEAIRW
jgi:heme-degrading monooxygenase HmoA